MIEKPEPKRTPYLYLSAYSADDRKKLIEYVPLLCVFTAQHGFDFNREILDKMRDAENVENQRRTDEYNEAVQRDEAERLDLCVEIFTKEMEIAFKNHKDVLENVEWNKPFIKLKYNKAEQKFVEVARITPKKLLSFHVFCALLNLSDPRTNRKQFVSEIRREYNNIETVVFDPESAQYYNITIVAK